MSCGASLFYAVVESRVDALALVLGTHCKPQHRLLGYLPPRFIDPDLWCGRDSEPEICLGDLDASTGGLASVFGVPDHSAAPAFLSPLALPDRKRGREGKR